MQAKARINPRPQCACGWEIPRVFVEGKRQAREVLLECGGCFVPIRVTVSKVE